MVAVRVKLARSRDGRRVSMACRTSARPFASRRWTRPSHLASCVRAAPMSVAAPTLWSSVMPIPLRSKPTGMSSVEWPKQARSCPWAPNLEPEPPAEHPSPSPAEQMGRRAQSRVQAAAGAALLRGRSEATSLVRGRARRHTGRGEGKRPGGLSTPSSASQRERFGGGVRAQDSRAARAQALPSTASTSPSTHGGRHLLSLFDFSEPPPIRPRRSSWSARDDHPRRCCCRRDR